MTMSRHRQSDIAPRTDRVADLTWDRIAARLAGGAVAILPIGAGAKEHGLHLPMATDQIQADWLSLRLAERLSPRFDTLIWPTLSYGHYPAFSAYAGSVSLSQSLFQHLVGEIAADILRFGARRLLVLDTGVSTIPAVAAALATVPSAVHLPIHDGAHYQSAVLTLQTQHSGGHADELETSRMLVIAPGLVDMARAFRVPGTRAMPAGALDPIDTCAPTYSPTGAMGDPSAATPEKGDVLLEAMLQDLLAATLKALAP
jgi:creatinine amidohydrolase